jgi:hypothetical protein
MRERDLTELLDTDRQDILSVYLDTDGRKPENRGAKPAYVIWLQHALRETLKGLSGDALRLAGRNARRITALVTRQRPTGRALIVFAGPGLWEEYHLPLGVSNRIAYGAPDVSILVDVLDQYKPYAILVVDHEHARILNASLGDATVIEEATLELHTEDWHSITGRKPTATRQFGTGVGRGAQRDTFDARVDARRRQFLTEAAHAAGRVMHEKGIERLILCGADDVTSEIRLALPPEARGKIIGVVALESHAGTAEIRDRTLPIALEAERRQDTELVKSLLERAAQGGGVTGIGPTMNALTEGRALTIVVDRNVLAEMPTLPLLARRHGARLAPVQGAPADGLRPYGGIGAILRYAVEPVMPPSPGSTA